VSGDVTRPVLCVDLACCAACPGVDKHRLCGVVPLGERVWTADVALQPDEASCSMQVLACRVEMGVGVGGAARRYGALMTVDLMALGWTVAGLGRARGCASGTGSGCPSARLQ
jgi:hypothetical protein